MIPSYRSKPVAYNFCQQSLILIESDPKANVNDSVDLGKPIIFVSIQYRVNIFAFAGESNQKNLALKDQSLALKWVQRHISAFNGDPVR